MIEKRWMLDQQRWIYHEHAANNDMPRSWDVYFKANGDDNGCRKNETIYDNVCPIRR